MKRHFLKAFTLVEVVVSLAIVSIIGGLSVGIYFYHVEEEKKKEYADIDDFFENAEDSVIKFESPTDKNNNNSYYGNGEFDFSNVQNKRKGQYIVKNVDEGITVQRTIDNPDSDGSGRYYPLGASEAYVYSIPVDVLTGVIIAYLTTLAGSQLGQDLDFMPKVDKKDGQTTGNYSGVNYSTIFAPELHLTSFKTIYDISNDKRFKKGSNAEEKYPDATYGLKNNFIDTYYNGRGFVLYDETNFDWTLESLGFGSFSPKDGIYTSISKEAVVGGFFNEIVYSKVEILVKRIGYITENKELKIISLAKNKKVI